MISRTSIEASRDLTILVPSADLTILVSAACRRDIITGRVSLEDREGV